MRVPGLRLRFGRGGAQLRIRAVSDGMGIYLLTDDILEPFQLAHDERARGPS